MIKITLKQIIKKIKLIKFPKFDLIIAIGKDGKTIERTRFLVKRYFDIKEIKVV